MAELFYRAFEERLRGSRELIKSRLRVYFPFIEPLKRIYLECSAIDLGCGRGEWLELLQEWGFDGMGVDLDDGMLEASRKLGLRVEKAEAIDFLRSMPDASSTVVSGLHVAEHVDFSNLQVLVQEALRVLRPAGLLILETPNPENLVVGAGSFYLDPSHQRPLPPLLLSFLPEYYGFARTKILRLQESPALQESANVTLLDVLAGVSPDYAVVAQREAGTTEQSALFDEAFRAQYGLDLETLALRYESRIAGALAQIDSQNARIAGVEVRVQTAESKVLAREAEIETIQKSYSWRLTKPLRLANQARRSLLASLGGSIRSVDRRLRILKGDLPRHAMLWVLNRPKLAAAARSTLARLPGLRARIKRHLAAPPPRAKSPSPNYGSDPDIPEGAARVLRDLQRARDR